MYNVYHKVSVSASTSPCQQDHVVGNYLKQNIHCDFHHQNSRTKRPKKRYSRESVVMKFKQSSPLHNGDTKYYRVQEEVQVTSNNI